MPAQGNHDVKQDFMTERVVGSELGASRQFIRNIYHVANRSALMRLHPGRNRVWTQELGNVVIIDAFP